MNIVYIIEVQDGSTRRREYRAKTLSDYPTLEQINAKGEEVLREIFTGEEDGEWVWDSSGCIAGRYYSFKQIPCDISFNIIEEILNFN